MMGVPTKFFLTKYLMQHQGVLAASWMDFWTVTLGSSWLMFQYVMLEGASSVRGSY